ncbi:hypothetical protein L1987_56225 [Smallanthus sonchifolius]|uniref:Uncharacterized protein n=1 Tax=Smallanthus sonchifolius TaxID=185202 RepID=A0ACB9EC32_9ASTR|nr:hypothetical protein L1987_56225 [Smallanthus sonchifolius]
MLLHFIPSLLTLALGTIQGSTSSAINNIAKPNCPTHCGNMTIPYPFGIDDESDSWIQLSAFSFSQKNMFIVLGCDDYSLMRGTKGVCGRVEDVPNDGQCSGRGCCQTSIPKGLDLYNISLSTFRNHTYVWDFNNCGYAFLGEEGSFVFRGASDLSSNWDAWDRIKSTVRIVVDWVIAPKGGCSESVECKENSSCHVVDGGGYRCKCNNGFEGNPYLDPGYQGQFPLYIKC